MSIPSEGVDSARSDANHEATPSGRQCVYCGGQGRMLERFDRFGPYMWVVCKWCNGKKKAA
jgi:DnaJ-class molecular chaperone